MVCENRDLCFCCDAGVSKESIIAASPLARSESAHSPGTRFTNYVTIYHKIILSLS